MKDRTKGYFLAIVATLAMANVFIFSKAALSEVHLIQFGVYWYLLGMIWLLLYLAIRRQLGMLKTIPRAYLKQLVLIGLLELGGTVFFFMAIQKMENPAMVSFLGNLTPLLITLLGVVLLHERYVPIEILGIVLTLGGAFLISYQKPGEGSGWLREGAEWVFLSATVYAVAFVMAKHSITNLNPFVLTLNRLVYLWLFSLGAMLVTGMSPVIPGKAFLNILLGSFLGPFLTGLTNYSAIQYLEASRTSIITSAKGFFVLVGAFIYLGLVPTSWQIWGGVLTVTGVILITVGKQMIRKSSKLDA
jgi:drug/metabolite transporter (DMT)-like permease